MQTEPQGLVKNIEQLLDVEREINRLIKRKRRTDLHVIGLEAAIYALETEYFREVAPLGSILTPAGIDAYLGAGTAPSVGNASAGSSARKPTIPNIADADRIFSNTSSSHQRVSYTSQLIFIQRLFLHEKRWTSSHESRRY